MGWDLQFHASGRWPAGLRWQCAGFTLLRSWHAVIWELGPHCFNTSFGSQVKLMPGQIHTQSESPMNKGPQTHIFKGSSVSGCLWLQVARDHTIGDSYMSQDHCKKETVNFTKRHRAHSHMQNALSQSRQPTLSGLLLCRNAESECLAKLEGMPRCCMACKV